MKNPSLHSLHSFTRYHYEYEFFNLTALTLLPSLLLFLRFLRYDIRPSWEGLPRQNLPACRRLPAHPVDVVVDVGLEELGYLKSVWIALPFLWLYPDMWICIYFMAIQTMQSLVTLPAPLTLTVLIRSLSSETIVVQRWQHPLRF